MDYVSFAILIEKKSTIIIDNITLQSIIINHSFFKIVVIARS